MSATLDQRLLTAHARRDRAALVDLYREAADHAASDTAKGFYLTHAYVYALEIGHPEAEPLHDRLKQMGREA